MENFQLWTTFKICSVNQDSGLWSHSYLGGHGRRNYEWTETATKCAYIILTSLFISLFLCISSNSYKLYIKSGNPLQSWILDSTLSIPDSRYWILEFVIGLSDPENGRRSGVWFRLHPTLFCHGDIQDSRKYDTFHGKQAVLFVSLLRKGLTQEINGDGGSNWWAPVYRNRTNVRRLFTLLSEFAFVYFTDFENCVEIYRIQAFVSSDPILFIKFVIWAFLYARRLCFGAGAMTYFLCGPPIRPSIMCVGRQWSCDLTWRQNNKHWKNTWDAVSYLGLSGLPMILRYFNDIPPSSLERRGRREEGYNAHRQMRDKRRC